MSSAPDIRRVSSADRDAAIARLTAEWGDPVRVRGETYAFSECEIFIAGDFEGLAAVSLRDRPIAELVAINAFERGRGIGTALIRAAVESLQGFETFRLTTTNDNLDALRFYQRRGFRLAVLRPGAVDATRKLKPTIPPLGDYGIPIRDEIDLVLGLSRG
ncbi:MAG: GNAT family N-acetyltransferase [Caulobacteraceae bacterium]|nr:GNAT family N-acetyltransferase [Caulobacteraceae bacterium]